MQINRDKAEAIRNEFLVRREKMNNVFRVTLQFRNRVVGGVPAVNVDPEASEEIQDEQAAKAKSILEVHLTRKLADTMTPEEIAAVVEQTYDEAYKDHEAQATSTFKVDENGLLLEGRQCKALIKEAGKRLGLGKAIKGSRPSLRQDIHEACHVDEDVIYLWEPAYNPVTEWIDDDGDSMPLEHVTEPHGYETRPIHVWGPAGPQSAIKRSAYVTQAFIQFHVRILECVSFNRHNLRDILCFGGDLGLGAERSQGFGKYDVVGFDDVEGGRIVGPPEEG